MNGYNQYIIKEFIKILNDLNKFSDIIEWHIDFVQKIELLFHTHRHNENEFMWIFPIYSWKMWWSYMVILNKWFSLSTMDKIMKDIIGYYPNAQVIYSSYKDGNESGWICIEQYSSNKLYSEFVPRWNAQFLDTKWVSVIWDHKELLDNFKNHLIMDTISKKIYYNWEKFTSKELVSQSFTTELFEHLIRNFKKDVYNYQLPSSSYSKSKSELISKILIPLDKLMVETFWKKIDIICKWSIIDYNILLKEESIPIWVIYSIHD